jgi:hypothetical protein
VHGGAPLFIFDVSNGVVLGIFQKAQATDALESIDEHAFRGQLPLQLRFVVVVEAPPLHLQDPEFMVSSFHYIYWKPPKRKILVLTSNLSSTCMCDQAVFPAGPCFGPIGLKETKQLANIFATRAGVMPMAGMESFCHQARCSLYSSHLFSLHHTSNATR